MPTDYTPKLQAAKAKLQAKGMLMQFVRRTEDTSQMPTPGGVMTSYSGVFDRLKACGTAPSAVTATLIDYDRDKERVAQACGRVEIRRVPLAFGAQCFVWTTPLHCAAGGYNLSFRSGVDCDAPKPPKLGCFWDIL